MLKLPIYLDYNATTPCDPAVVEAMMPFFTTHFGNAASRSHPFGWEAAEAVDYSREHLAHLTGAGANEIIFTSGATESVNLAIKGVFDAYASKGNHIITVVTEHKAVLDTCGHLEKLGAEVTYLGVKRDGLIEPGELEAAITSKTILIAVMYANNETGVIQPIREIGEVARRHGIIFFCDATQAVGKTPVNVNSGNIDLMAFSAHKMYGPKGVGALYVRRKAPRVKIIAQMDGGGHERGMRSGTLNVSGIAGFGKACEIAAEKMETEMNTTAWLRDMLEKGLSKLGEIQINGSKEFRMSHVSNISFKYVDGDALMTGFNKNIAVSSGSACTSASPEPSYVLKALGLEDDMARSSLRFSLGRQTTEEEIVYAIEQISKTVMELRNMNPTWKGYKKEEQVNC